MDARPRTRTRRVAMILAVLSTLVVTACSPPDIVDADTPAPRAAVCDHTRPGPKAPPAGAVTVDPAVDGDLSAKTEAHPPGTTFWLAPGRHTLGRDKYGQVSPKDGNTYLGAPGAVLDGRGLNRYAFVFKASRVTVSHLTIRGFVPPINEGVVNHDFGADWVIEHNTLEDNGGAALMAGDRQQVRGNCLRDNGQYGMNAFGRDLVIEGNEFVGNNAEDTESQHAGCGCSGAMKFWTVNGADIRGNWIHDNRGAGIWADTNNNDFVIEGNLIEDNDGAAIFYETSYNAVIRDNTIRRNTWVSGWEFAGRGDNFPVATIYLSESGGEPRIPARTDKIDIHGNVFENNWSGITLWENADRFCNSPANTSTGYCTLLVPTVSKCAHPAIATEPLRSDCRWKTQRVVIHGNQFTLDPKTVGCEEMCTRMAILSNAGTVPDWSPYHGDVVQKDITFNQDNRWHHNSYTGPWTFMPHDTGQLVDAKQWQAAPYGQDHGSTFFGHR